MNGIIAWWGKNPVAGNLLMVACIAAGLFAFMRMEKEFWPPGRENAVSIDAVWPGASPEDMETQVTARLEEAIADLDGVDWVRSRSMEGYAWIRVIAEPDVDMAAMTAEVRSRVDAVTGLPPGLEPPRVTQQVGRNWSIILSVHGDVSEATLRETSERVRDRIALLPGAANTIVSGARRPEVSIELSEDAMRRYGLTFDEVAQAIRQTSVNISGGSVRTPDGDFQLRARNQAESDVDFAQIVVRQTEDGGVVRVGDVATVIDGFEDVNMWTRSNGERSVLVAVQTADRFDITETSPAVNEALEELRQQLPAGVQITKVYDEYEDWTSLTGILFSNAMQGFVLIFVLLLLTLHPKVAFWSTLGVITAFAGSFILLPALDVSLNFMTVFGFLLVLGIMVDDAIIVGESIYERIERGERGADAAILATQIVFKPVLASVLTTMIAFSPLMLISGEVQQFTRSISIVVMLTLIFSLVECLIILPAHLAKVEPLVAGRPGFMGRLASVQVACANSVTWFAEHMYGPALRFCMRFRYATLAAFVVAFALGISLIATGRVGQSFMPEVEGDFMSVQIEMPRTTPYGRMLEVAEQLDAARIALESETSEIAVEDQNTGALSRGVVRSWNQAINETTIQAWVALTPPETRPDLRSKAIAERLKALMGTVPDAERLSFELSGNNNAPSIQIALLGEDRDELRAAVEDLKAKLLTYEAVSSVRDSEEAANEELRFTLKPGAEQLGVTLAMVSSQVRQAYFGEEVQRLPRNGEDVRVYVRYPQQDRRTLGSLENFRVRTPDGREIPLSQVADVAFAPGVTGLDRRQRMRSILVEAEAPQEERAKIMRDLEQSGFFNELEQRYPTVTRRALGQAEAQQEFMNELLGFGLIALFVMYALLAVTFRSYGQPGLIMSVIPFAVMGAAIGHFMFGLNFALFSWLGMVAAMGVIVNDNVVLVDRANRLVEEGADEVEAMYDAGVSRFRQIFLTSITEFVGLAPMLFEAAAVAQFLKPMAVSLAFGVLLAMPVTLLLTPVLAAIAVDIKRSAGGGVRWARRMWAAKPPAETPAE